MSDVARFAASAKGFTKNPLGIIALFIVLVYGFAALAVTFGSNIKEHITPLIYFLVFFPVLVFVGFLWLVAVHHEKMYGPSDFKNEDNFLRMKLSTVASLAAADVKQPGRIEGQQAVQSRLESIVDLVAQTSNSRSSSNSGQRKRRILWVDDRPENNIYERQAFESQGIQISIALSTDEALEMLNRNNYDAIISDMGRNEGPQEGYVLLDQVRRSGNRVPYFIYAGSNLPEHKKMAKEKGAQGSTNQARDLYRMVIHSIDRPIAHSNEY